MFGPDLRKSPPCRKINAKENTYFAFMVVMWYVFSHVLMGKQYFVEKRAAEYSNFVLSGINMFHVKQKDQSTCLALCVWNEYCGIQLKYPDQKRFLSNAFLIYKGSSRNAQQPRFGYRTLPFRSLESSTNWGCQSP